MSNFVFTSNTNKQTLQRLAIATPILTGLTQADWHICRILPGEPTSQDLLAAKALGLVDALLNEVQKQ